MRGRRRRRRIVALIALIVVGLSIGVVGTRAANERRCLGECRGVAATCEEIDAWVEAVRADEAWPRPTSPLRARVLRARVPHRDGRPCGARAWALDSLDERIFE